MIWGKYRLKSRVNWGGPPCHGHWTELSSARKQTSLLQLTEKTQWLPSSPKGLTSDFKGAQGGRIYDSFLQTKRGPETLCPGKNCFLGKPKVTISTRGYNSKWTPGFHGHWNFFNSSSFLFNLQGRACIKEVSWTSSVLLKQEDE